MTLDPSTYPSRTFIRFTVNNQLLADVTDQTITASVQRLGGQTYVQKAVPGEELPSLSRQSMDWGTSLKVGQSIQTPASDHQESWIQAEPPVLDEELLAEVTQTAFHDHPHLYQDCGSAAAAAAVEAEIATEIIAAYRTIKQKQACPIVQSLNQLL